MFPPYGELRPTSGWDRLVGLGHPSKFQWQRLSRLSFVTAATSINESQPNFARCLVVSWSGRLFIHFRRLLPRNGILPGAKFTLRPPSLALSYIGSVAARHLSSGSEPNCAALSTRRHLYSAGRPSRWALAHILVAFCFFFAFSCLLYFTVFICVCIWLFCSHKLVNKDVYSSLSTRRSHKTKATPKPQLCACTGWCENWATIHSNLKGASYFTR